MHRGGKDYHAEENASTYQKSHTGHAWSGHIPESQSAHQTQPHQIKGAHVCYEKVMGIPLSKA